MELPNTFFNHDAQAGGFYPKSHVGIDVSKLGQHQNTLIEGIRGTGKTHVLKMILRYHLDNFEKLRVFPIYISLAQISEHARKEPDEFRLHLYAHIVQKCVETAEIYRSYLQPDKTLLEKALIHVARLFKISSEPDFNELLHQIKQIADLLLFKLQFDLTSKNFKDINSDTETVSGSINASVGIKTPVKLGFGSEVQTNQSITKGAEESLTYIGSRLVHRDAAAFLIEFLKQIQIIFGLEYSLILLDECSEASFSSQVEIFRLFKTIRGATAGLPNKNTCAFFVGTVYPKGETYYPTRDQDGFSFEIGQDCTMEFLQWDETDLDSYISFFENMTLNRAKDVLGFQGTFDDFCGEYFEDKNTFLISAYCAHGIPRRYWELIKRAYDHNAGKMLYSRAGIAIQEIASEQILGHSSLNDQDSRFIHALIRSLKSENQKTKIKNQNRKFNTRYPQNLYFSVARKFSESLRHLIMQGAIHDKSRMRTLRRAHLRPQPVYALDMAVCYTFQVTRTDDFATAITQDLPLCRENDFKYAVVISAQGIEKIYKSTSSTSEEYIEIVDNAELETDEGRAGEISTGIIKAYTKSKSGRIKVDDGGMDALFQDNNIEKGSIKTGDRVQFTNRWTKTGERLAIHVRKLNSPKPVDGIVKSYEVGSYGSIEVLDGGPDAFFTAGTLDSTLVNEIKPGDRIHFTVFETRLGRQAENISLQTSTLTNKPSVIPGELSGYIINYVKSSPAPVSMGKLALQVRTHFGDSVSNTQWFGCGTFKNLLNQLDLEDLDISPLGPSYVFDPTKHSIGSTIETATLEIKESPDELKSKYPRIATIARKIHQLGFPYLTPKQYRLAFEVIASWVNENGFNLSQVSKAIRDKSQEMDNLIPRSNSSWIVKSYITVDYQLGNQEESPDKLAEIYIQAIYRACQNSKLDLSENDKVSINEWINVTK